MKSALNAHGSSQYVVCKSVLPRDRWDKPRQAGGPDNPPDPPAAIGIPLSPGDAVIFDRRLFHSEPLNPFKGTWPRRMVFLGYSQRWLRTRDEMTALGHFGGKCA